MKLSKNVSSPAVMNDHDTWPLGTVEQHSLEITNYGSVDMDSGISRIDKIHIGKIRASAEMANLSDTNERH